MKNIFLNKLNIIEGDLSKKEHAEAFEKLTDAYALDPMGLGRPLPVQRKEILIDALKKFPLQLIYIAYLNGKPAGLATCFFSFSTFHAAKVKNIHDLVVLPEYRSNGIGNALLEAVEKKAKAEKCCKVTLEVRTDNSARNLYERFGFTYGKPKMYFMSKLIK